MFGKLKFVGRDLKRDLRVYQLALQDPRTPKLTKLLLRFSVAYALFSFDFIPDFIPVIGHMDDAVVVPAVIRLALRLIPDDVIDECRMEVGQTGKAPRRAKAKSRRK